ncbi:MAG: tRNA pseudouridine(55) synthase TruB [Acidobacteria bacterium]|nr:tRNA pseudouridine(55) synthase TruB [Acidobacteriota bacterium]
MDGILIIDKPAGLTSHDVVARVRRILRERRIGHTGTLDPFATGVLVMLVGRATRLAQFLASADKEYEALIRFGYATETGDATGARRAASNIDEPTAQPSMDWSEREIEAALASLRGETRQVPPMYSAKKVKGQKLYELARQGIEVERARVVINVRELEAVRRDDDATDGGGGRALLQHNEDGTCDLSVRVVCSAGTYVRVLAEGIGEGLGVGAHLVALRRTRAGTFSLTEAITLDELEEIAREGAAMSRLFSLNAALSWMPAAHLTGEAARRARHGVAVRPAAETLYVNDQPVRLVDEQGALIAVAIYKAETEDLRPRVVIAPEK